MKPRILISGASKGIGRHLALHLAETHDVVTFARSQVREAGDDPRARRVTHHAGIDVRRLESLRQLDLGAFDALVNNVGIAHDGLLATQPVPSIEEIIQVNLLSVILVTKWYVRERLAQGRAGVIVTISSIAALRGFSGLAVYSATKGALDALTRSLARELGRQGFRVNAVLPGYVETDLSKDLSPQRRQQIIRRTPLGRLATPNDVVPVVEFLLSDKARFITGQSLVVDGGLTV